MPRLKTELRKFSAIRFFYWLILFAILALEIRSPTPGLAAQERDGVNPSAECDTVFFGPATFESREDHQKNSEVAFRVPVWVKGEFVLRVEGSSRKRNNKIPPFWIKINGQKILGPKDRIRPAQPLEKIVSLKESNRMLVRVEGHSGSSITVSLCGKNMDHTPPTIQAQINPVPNASGWVHRLPVTVDFQCNDTLSGLKICSDPATFVQEGSSQTAVGVGIDQAGLANTLMVIVHIDTSPASVVNMEPSDGAILRDLRPFLGADLFDHLSGVDPDSAQIFLDGRAVGSFATESRIVYKPTEDLSVGEHEWRVRTTDKAGNPFADSASRFTVVGPATEIVPYSPQVAAPNDSSLPAELLAVEQSSEPVPDQLGSNFHAVSQVYEVGLDLTKIDPESGPPEGVEYYGEPAQIRFPYNKDALQEAGLIEEFAVLYLDKTDGAWKPVDRMEVDLDNNLVIAYTHHFTPFVLTALPASSGTVANPPSCIAADYPTGVSGSGNAVFTVIDTHFKYYQDRDYYIVPNAAFDALGFSQALGLATCNGNSPCGPFSKHKQFNGNNYIVFTAHANIDVFLMYDTRGGSDLNDASQDASWISATGFENTGFFIETTDSVRYYRVYKKTYLKGDEVQLHGNKKGAGSGINTNYWLVLRRAGTMPGAAEPEPAASMCESQPDLTPPQKVMDLAALAGPNHVTLTWRNPLDPDFAGVLIRRSTAAPPAVVSEGVPPTGIALSSEAYRDEGLSLGVLYHYSVFTLDHNYNYLTGASISAITSVDSDGDGLSDAYENSMDYGLLFPGSPPPDFTDPAIPDTDGDGVSDSEEAVRLTDPTNPDAEAPDVTDFSLQTSSITSNPHIQFALTAADNTGIAGWLVRSTDTPPSPRDTEWLPEPPSSHTLLTTGVHQLYAWVKDAAGNVSPPITPISVRLEITKRDRFLYTATPQTGEIHSYAVDWVTGVLTPLPVINVGGAPHSLAVDALHRFLFVGDMGSDTIRTFRIDIASGSLTQISSYSSGINGVRSLAVDPSSKLIVGQDALTVLDVDPITGALSGQRRAFSKVVRVFPHPSGSSVYSLSSDRWIREYIIGSLGIGQSYVLDFSTKTIHPLKDLTFSPKGDFAYMIYEGWRVAVLSELDAWPKVKQEFSINTGTITPLALTSIKTSTNGRFIYILTHHVIQNTQFLLTLNRDVNSGLILSNEDLSSITYPETIPFQPPQYGVGGQLLLSSNGRFAYIVSANGTASSLSLDDNGGPPSLTSYVLRTLPTPVMSSDRYWRDWVLFSMPEGNAAPIARAGEGGRRTFGDRIYMNGRNSIDPDRADCGADPTKYAYAWRFLSVPEGSTLTDSDIPNRYTLSAPSFAPDVKGDYTIEFQFTDDPGTCSGTPKTSTSTVVYKVQERKRRYATYTVKNPADYPSEKPTETSVWNTTLIYQGESGYYKRYYIWVRRCYWIFGCRWKKSYFENPTIYPYDSLMYRYDPPYPYHSAGYPPYQGPWFWNRQNRYEFRDGYWEWWE